MVRCKANERSNLSDSMRNSVAVSHDASAECDQECKKTQNAVPKNLHTCLSLATLAQANKVPGVAQPTYSFAYIHTFLVPTKICDTALLASANVSQCMEFPAPSSASLANIWIARMVEVARRWVDAKPHVFFAVFASTADSKGVMVVGLH